MKKKHYIRENSLLWRLGQVAVITVLGLGIFAPGLGIALVCQALKEFVVGLL